MSQDEAVARYLERAAKILQKKGLTIEDPPRPEPVIDDSD